MPSVKTQSNLPSTQQSFGLSAIKSRGSWEDSTPSTVTSRQRAFSPRTYTSVCVCVYACCLLSVCYCVSVCVCMGSYSMLGSIPQRPGRVIQSDAGAARREPIACGGAAELHGIKGWYDINMHSGAPALCTALSEERRTGTEEGGGGRKKRGVKKKEKKSFCFLRLTPRVGKQERRPTLNPLPPPPPCSRVNSVN